MRKLTQFAICILHFSICTAPVLGGEPTLARLAFWVPPERMAEFEVAYEQQFVPLLDRLGLVPSDEPGRATPDSVFTRLFRFGHPSDLWNKYLAFFSDTDVLRLLGSLGREFGIVGGTGAIRMELSVYRAPGNLGVKVAAGKGTRVPAGRGRGYWRPYDATNGVTGGPVNAILQDRQGYVWLGTGSGGLVRYDGIAFTTVLSRSQTDYITDLLEDGEGAIWVATDGKGLGRYDGEKWEWYTVDDGLGSDYVRDVMVDRSGVLWVCTSAGPSRFDPRIESGAGSSAGSRQTAWDRFVRTVTAVSGSGRPGGWPATMGRALPRRRLCPVWPNSRGASSPSRKTVQAVCGLEPAAAEWSGTIRPGRRSR